MPSAEIYQSDGTFVPAADMLRARAGHTCTTLSDGRVLVAGGLGDGPAVQAETFDPATNTWTPAENGTERWNHTATLLPDGRVLLAGGETSNGPSDLLEWFDPRTNRIRAGRANLAAARTLHASALLPDGGVLVSGGWNGQTLMDAAEVVKLDGSVRSTAALPAARAGHTASTLDNGCVLIAGGLGVDGDLKSASLYCADPGTFRPAGEMSVARFVHLAIVLPNNGQVLITGGFSQGEATAASELYDPVANIFTPAGSLTRARLGIAVAADPAGGAVLAVGGYTADGPIAACGILRGPAAAFEKTRYVDGETVTVAGFGWTPGERVNLVLTTTSFASPGTVAQVVVQNFQTTASRLGRIQQDVFTTTGHSAGSTFRINVAGVVSERTAGNSARQISRTNMTLNVSPFQALTRQPVLLQAIVQPVSALDQLDGSVNFQTGTAPLGSVSSTGQIFTVSATGQITDGTSNTILFGETTPLPASSSGFSTSFIAADGSVRNVSPGGVFQLVTRDLPPGSNVLSATSTTGSVNAAYTPFASLYAPSSASSIVSVQKRTVNVSILTPLFQVGGPRVGDQIRFNVLVTATQQPAADVSPAGNVHFSFAPGSVVDGPLSPASVFGASAAALASVPPITLPAGTRSFSAQYDGDSVYLSGGVLGGGTITVNKGLVGFSLTPGRSTYTVGEQITMSARIQHPRVIGATPTGQITRASGPAQFQGATVGTDPQNTGIIDVTCRSPVSRLRAISPCS